MLTTEMGLVKRRAHKFPTGEELKRERTELPALEWVFFPRHGEDIVDSPLRFKGEDVSEIGSGYFIQYAGYVCYESPKPNVQVDSRYLLIYHPSDARKIVMICRLQIFHRSCQGYVETYWNPRPRSFNLKNLSPENADKEAKILLAAKSLVFTVERQYRGGRPAGLPKALEVIHDDYINLCACHQYLYSDNARPSQPSMADFYEVNRSSLYRHLKNTFGISFSDVRSECESRLRPIAVDDLPYRFQRYLERKRMEQATDTLVKR
jgi:AraC-like DNA-binding protein